MDRGSVDEVRRQPNAVIRHDDEGHLPDRASPGRRTARHARPRMVAVLPLECLPACLVRSQAGCVGVEHHPSTVEPQGIAIDVVVGRPGNGRKCDEPGTRRRQPGDAPHEESPAGIEERRESHGIFRHGGAHQ